MALKCFRIDRHNSDRFSGWVQYTIQNHVHDSWRIIFEQGLSPAQKSIVEEAQAKGHIDFRQEDQSRAVKEIVDLIAVDPPFSMVNRLITSFNKVSSCSHRKQKDLVIFVDRFRGLASKHLIHTGFGTSSYVGEVLLTTFINHANLQEKTLQNAIF